MPDPVADTQEQTLTAADVMTPSPRDCSLFSTVLEAVMIMRDEDCGAVPIVDQGRPVGIITDRDVALALSEWTDLARRPVSEIMTTDPVTVTGTTSLTDVREQLSTHGVRRLLVVDDSQALRGIISWADLAMNLPHRAIGRTVTEVLEQPPRS
jgi:CBS domain-containing protein